MTIGCDLTISFAAAGNSLAYLGGGWAPAEAGFTWAIGRESHLIFPRLDPAGARILTLDVVPFIHTPGLPSQRLTVSIGDTVLGSAVLSRPTLLGFRVPAFLLRGAEPVVITLRHPDAARPSDIAGSTDVRPLALAVHEARMYRVSNAEIVGSLPVGLMLHDNEHDDTSPDDMAAWAARRTGLTLPQLAMKFESVGENCEFGLFQRRCDAEPLGLLRFSSTFMRNLIRGIDSGFTDLGKIDALEPQLSGGPPREYMIHEQNYGLVYHSFVYEGQRSLWLLREQESARLAFLRRKFIEELELSEKIFVYKRNFPVSEAEILPLHMALQRYGNATLLWVVPAEPHRPPGTVEVIMPGVWKGYIDRFAPEHDAHDLSFDGWLRVCANACVLAGLRDLSVHSGSTRPRLRGTGD